MHCMYVLMGTKWTPDIDALNEKDQEQLALPLNKGGWTYNNMDSIIQDDDIEFICGVCLFGDDTFDSSIAFYHLDSRTGL